MPELPEVEHLRRTLAPRLIGARIASVRLERGDVLRAGEAPVERALLKGFHVDALERHGKELAIRAREGRVLCVHLGMSGQLVLEDPRAPTLEMNHRHATWTFVGRSERLVFRDPRRFGALTALTDAAHLKARWSARGPDALLAQPNLLLSGIAERRAPIKSVLLDQSVIAGVGNIYADEALFAAGIHPLRPARSLEPAHVRTLVRALRATLRRALRSGGSSLRDYRDGRGRRGAFQFAHTVYGRSGEPCRECGAPLASGSVAGRTTVWCPLCQS